MKHTKGPWGLAYESKAVRSYDGSVLIADCIGGGKHAPANAALIAAAPDLLSALETMLSIFEPTVDVLSGGMATSTASIKARAAIAKAKGEIA